MMIKIMGVVLIIGGFGCYGLIKASSMEKRIKQIKNIRLAMVFLEKEISYVHSILPDALSKTGRFATYPVNYLFQESAKELKNKNGVLAEEAWIKGLEKLREHSDLNDEDIEILTPVAMQIGVSNSIEQSKFLRLVQEELKIIEENNQEELSSKKKIWSYGGFIVGTMIVLLLL